MLSIGLIGCGLWGPNLARNFDSLRRSRVKVVCDSDLKQAQILKKRLKDAEVTDDYEQVICDRGVDAVVVATPLSTHYEIARKALEAGKHVFVEKPLTSDSGTSRELTDLADRLGLVLMSGYVFLFNRAVLTARAAVHSGELGEIQYLHAVRTNLGPIRMDTNALWDLASHDISIFLYCLEEDPVSVSGTGGRFVGNPAEDVAFAGIRFRSGRMGFIYVSWLDPCKNRQVTIVGTKKMLLLDDMAPSEPIRIYDKGIQKDDFYDSYGAHRMAVRSGDIVIPHIRTSEPLLTECEAFIEAVLDGKANPAMGDLPVKVARVLESVDRSMAADGAPIEIEA
jgi:predicted dehydrogenase